MFSDRFDAAHKLAALLKSYKDNPDVVILAIPRGGLEIGYVLAQELHAPLDVLLTKKIGAPYQPEVAIGAVSLDHVFIDQRFAHLADALKDYIKSETQQIRQQLEKRSEQYHGARAPIELSNKIVIITDDGVATGHTLLAAIALVKKENPREIIVAVPVAPRDTAQSIAEVVNDCICLEIPSVFYSVSQFYRQFPQVEDEEAIRLLREANQ